MRPLVLLLLVPLLVPSVLAGTPDGPDIVDPEGDGGSTPCSAATDLVSFWAVWDADALVLHYRFSDLSAVEEHALLQDGTGRCFYSYNELHLRVGDRRVEDAVYMDYNGNPAFQTGWRFYFHESGDVLEGTVDLEVDEIQVRIPYALVGTPSPGDRVGDFRIQVTNNVEGAGLAYQGDWAPDDAKPCGCWVVYEEAAPAEPSMAPAAPAKEAPAAFVLLPLALALLARRSA